MSDDLLKKALDLATMLSGGVNTQPHADTVRALVERVQAAEQEAETQAGIAAIRTAERDEARGKLDKVRETVTAELECLLHDDDDPVQCGWKRTVRDVLAILDGDNGR